MKFDQLPQEAQQEYQKEYNKIMWDIEDAGVVRKYGAIDFLIDGVIAFSAVQLIDGTIKSIRGPPGKDKDDDKKGGPPGGGSNKFMGLFGGDKKVEEPVKKKIDINNDIFR